MRTTIIRALAVVAGTGMSAGFIPAAQAADAVTGQRGARPATSCGVWCWPVKTGADHDRQSEPGGHLSDFTNHFQVTTS
jgi:hypothetical protein